MGTIFDSGKYWYRVVRTTEGRDSLYRAPGSDDYKRKVEEDEWTIVKFQNPDKDTSVLFDQINNFFGTKFAPEVNAGDTENNSIFVTKDYYYRVVDRDGKKILQRAEIDMKEKHINDHSEVLKGERILVYDGPGIADKKITWKDVHTGDKLIFHISEILLIELNEHFKTNFQRYPSTKKI